MGMGVQNGAASDDEDSYRPVAEINITPMVDVMLVLLIIFMVAAPLMVAGVPLELPNTSAAKVSQTKKPMVVSFTADGQLFVRDEAVPKDGLVAKLRSIRAAEGDSVVYVRSDRKNAYGDVMEILGRVGEGGYGRVSLLSQPSPKSAPAGPAGAPSP
jgi:biopolymer transport protein TolR